MLLYCPRFSFAGPSSREVSIHVEEIANLIMIGLLRSRGFTEVVLWVLAENMDARRFYEKMGFTPDGASRTIILGKPLEAVRYHKTLA